MKRNRGRHRSIERDRRRHARALAGDGFQVVLGARRLERLEALAAEIGGEAIALDVTDPARSRRSPPRSRPATCSSTTPAARSGWSPSAEADEEQWRTMYESNVLGTMRMTRALLPRLIASGDGHVVGVTSIAAFETYRGGAGYTAAKHAQRAVLRTLRLELLGEPVSVTEVAPGMVETEFSLVRFERRRGGGGQGLRGHGAAARRGRRRVHPLGASPSPPTSTSTRSSSGRATRRPRPRSTAGASQGAARA